MWQRLTQRCCHQLGLHLPEKWWNGLPGQVLLQDGAVHGVQSLPAGEAHSEDAEVALQKWAEIEVGTLPHRG